MKGRCLNLADSVAKLLKCRSTDFSPKQETNANRKLMWPQIGYGPRT
jgi:hypothetical protein